MSRRLRPWVIGIGALNVVLAITLVVVLISRGPGGDAPEQAAEVSSAPPSTDTVSTPEPDPATATDSSPTPTPEATYEVPEGALAVADFTLPSGNIGCSLTPDAGECWIRDFSYTPPVAGQECEWFGALVTFTAQGLVMPCPASQPGSNAAGAAVLEYGQSTAVGPWLCTSTRDGLECSSLADGTGFTIARAAFTSYGPGRLV